ncbi:hypothetical protein ACUXVY_12845 [Chromobacterium haemolyticum]|uniref:hypothetical protein n=1 Tax=Chromobacterium haemolyticum TaxID=394935 RepID=UPI004056EDD0
MKMTIMHNGVTATIDGTAEECAKFLRELSMGLVPTVGWGQPAPKVDLTKSPDAVAYAVSFTHKHVPAWKLYSPRGWFAD